MEQVRGYKVFNSDWTCRSKQYTCPGKFEEDVDPECCERGMHFCINAADCFNYYNFNSENHVAEVIAYGQISGNGDKYCTDKLEIVREIPWAEVLTIVNIGKDCAGFGNTGDWNTGNCNTGDWNTGNRNAGNYNAGNRNTGNYNTGDCNTGNCNTGDCNIGNWNTGNRNTGNCNTGDWNTGSCNTGDWNTSSFNTGCFVTEEQPIMMFNKLSSWSHQNWMHSDARYLLDRIPKNVIEWVESGRMTDEEKSAYPTYEITGGYLKMLSEDECGQIWWDGLTEEEKEVIRNLPNFDSEIFKQCTGIKVD